MASITIWSSTLLVLVAIVFASVLAIKTTHESFDPLQMFKDATGSEPRNDEAARLQELSKSATEQDVKDVIQRSQPPSNTEERMKAAAAEFDTAMRDAARDPSPSLKKSLAAAYRKLLCIATEFDSLKQFYAFLQGTYKDMLPVLYEALSESPIEPACDTFHPDNLAYQEMRKGNFGNKEMSCSFLGGQKCDMDSRVALKNIAGKKAYDVADAWAAKNCSDYGGKCKTTEGMADAPGSKESNASADVQYVLNQPHIIYNFYGEGGAGGGKSWSSSRVSPSELEDKVLQQCKLDAASKLPNVNDVRRDREVDDMKNRCDMSTKYSNADNFGKLFPEYEWSVPQPRAPVCIPTAPCRVQAVQSQSALIGTLLGDASDTQVGSMMPGFQYKENDKAASVMPAAAASETAKK
jgi:hypothetical protein